MMPEFFETGIGPYPYLFFFEEQSPFVLTVLLKQKEIVHLLCDVYVALFGILGSKKKPDIGV